MTRPVQVSVVCATYNRGPAISSTLKSVLSQDLPDLELIVVSDGSTDDTDLHVASMADADPRTQLIVVEHSGIPSRAMNVGIDAARGHYIAYIDHDDHWTPEHLRLLIDELEHGADLVATGSVWVDDGGRLLSERPAAALLWHPDIQVINPVFENSQAAHPAAWIDRVGTWREEPFGFEDWDMWLRFADAGARVATVQTPTVRKTMASSNRHRHLPKPYTFELASCRSVHAARQAQRALVTPTTTRRLADAAAADTDAWYHALAHTDQFVFPRGFAADRAEAIARLPQALREGREADRGLEDPVTRRIEDRAGRAALVQEVGCMTAEHADRFASTVRRAHPRVFAVIDEVTAPYRTAGAAAVDPPPTPKGTAMSALLTAGDQELAARDLYIDLIERVLVNSIYEDPGMLYPDGASREEIAAHRELVPFDPKRRSNGFDFPTQAHTMIGSRRMRNLRECVEAVIADDVPGDLVETGVWRGGATIFMRAILKAYGVTDRTVWVADSFEGLPPADTDAYPIDEGIPFDAMNDVLGVSLAQVQENFRRYDLLDDQVRFIKGYFRDTLPSAPVEQIAVLRLDGDMYESTINALDALYPKLCDGGFLILDDYRIVPACRQAVNDYRAAHDISTPMTAIDTCGSYWRKGS